MLVADVNTVELVLLEQAGFAGEGSGNTEERIDEIEFGKKDAVVESTTTFSYNRVRISNTRFSLLGLF